MDKKRKELRSITNRIWETMYYLGLSSYKFRPLGLPRVIRGQGKWTSSRHQLSGLDLECHSAVTCCLLPTPGPHYSHPLDSVLPHVTNPLLSSPFLPTTSANTLCVLRGLYLSLDC